MIVTLHTLPPGSKFTFQGDLREYEVKEHVPGNLRPEGDMTFVETDNPRQRNPDQLGFWSHLQVEPKP